MTILVGNFLGSSGFYQLIAGTGFENFLIHADGLAHLVEARGPSSFQNPLELRIFESLRGLIVSAKAC